MSELDPHIQAWLNADPRELEKHVVGNDHYDRVLMTRTLDSMPPFVDGQMHLSQTVPTAEELWADTFWSFWQVEPELLPQGEIRPSHALDWSILAELATMDDYDRLRRETLGDDVASAMACLDMRAALETLWDKLKGRQERLERFEVVLVAVAEGEASADDAAALAAEIETDLRSAGPLIANALASAVRSAAQNGETLSAQCELWGTHAGAGGKLDAEERMALASRLNNESMRLLFEMLGPMSRLMNAVQSRRIDHLNQEVYELERGNDISRMVPSELAKIRHPVLGLDVRRRYLERGIPQVKLRGRERVAKGDIICLLDLSGSMGGARERWGKAVALCLLMLAVKQKRGFHGIHFGSASEVKEFPFDTSNISIHDVIAYAEYNRGGGTDFEAPLSRALKILQKDHEATGNIKADVVMITDAECRVREKWLTNYLSEMDRLQSRTWGFLVQKNQVYQMPEICGDNLVMVEDIANGEDATKMFGAL